MASPVNLRPSGMAAQLEQAGHNEVEGKLAGQSAPLGGSMSAGMDAADAIDAFEQLEGWLQEQEVQPEVVWHGGVSGQLGGLVQQASGCGGWGGGGGAEQDVQVVHEAPGHAPSVGGRGCGFDAADEVCPFEQLECLLVDRERRPGTASVMDPMTWFALFKGEERPFWPSRKFMGEWVGTVFKTGELGTGYYVYAGLAKAIGGGVVRRGIPLYLDRLVERISVGGGCTREWL